VRTIEEAFVKQTFSVEIKNHIRALQADMERSTSLRNVAVAEHVMITGRLAMLVGELEAQIKELETLLERRSMSAGQSPEAACEPILNRLATGESGPALRAQFRILKARFDEEADRVRA